MKNESLVEYMFLTCKIIFNPKDKQGVHLSHKKRRIRNEIIKYYEEFPSDDTSINEALRYLKNYGFQVPYPYPFREKYESRNFKLSKDSDRMLYYVMDGKKLYLKQQYSKHVAQKILCSLAIEQDPECAHCYLSDFLTVEEGDVMADIGCAEAYLALKVIDKLSHLYLFEYDDSWIEALQKTFEPWKEKVTIVKQIVGDKDSGEEIRLDTFFKDKLLPTFIKMDVEGMEAQCLNGLGSLLENPSMKLAVTTYHRQNDYEDVLKIMTEHQFKTEVSKGYMLYSLDGFNPPYFRHGVIRAKK